MADIFLSYAREDRPWAAKLAAGLIEHGWSLFWDPDIPVGKTFDQVIENQLDAARCIVVLWSRRSVSSNWVKAEASEGLNRRILHPVLIEKVRLPLEFRRLQTANLIDWQKGTSHAEYDQLVSGIAATLRSSRARAERRHEARVALWRGDNTECLENADLIAATETTDSGNVIAELKRIAEAERDEAHRAEVDGQRVHAETQRAVAAASRSRAQAADAANRASASWLAAEIKITEAATAFDEEAYLRAAQYYDEAIDVYGKAGAEALEAASRQKVERQPMAAEPLRGQKPALESEQPSYRREPAPLRIDTEQIPSDRASSGENGPIGADNALSGGHTASAPAEPANAADAHSAAAHYPEQLAIDVQPSEQPALAGESERDPVEGARTAMAWYREAVKSGPQSTKARRPVVPRVAVRWLAACVVTIAVVLSGFGIAYRNRSADREPQERSVPVPPAPQPPEPLSPQRNPEQEATTPSPGGLEDLRKQTAEARVRATKASAEQLANALFIRAAARQSDAEHAIADGRVPDAQAAYRQALDGFTAASAQVEQVLKQKQDETARLRRNVDDFRGRAVAAQAEKFAQTQWTNATHLYRQAEAAVARGDHDQADKLLDEARAGFENATRIATAGAAGATRPVTPTRDDVKGPSSTARAEAEHAQLRMLDAKHAADQVAARFYADRRYTSAQSRERDGADAFKHSDYKTALRLFAEAQSEYQTSVQDARVEAERDAQLAPLRASVDEARSAAVAQRKRALDAQADNLAAHVFDLAQAAHVRADALAGSRDLVAAAGAYQDAAERYGDATLQAQAARAAK